MSDEMRVMLEIGPKGKRVVAVALEWPGLERGAKNEDDAIERLESYRPRYARVAQRAGLGTEFDSGSPRDVVERYPAPARPISGASRSPFLTSTGSL